MIQCREKYPDVPEPRYLVYLVTVLLAMSHQLVRKYQRANNNTFNTSLIIKY